MLRLLCSQAILVRYIFSSNLTSGYLSANQRRAKCGFLFNLDFFRLWLILALYISTCTFLSWIFYHAQGKIRWGVCTAFSLCPVLQFLRSIPAAVVLAISLCAVWIYVYRFLSLNIPKYYERLQSIESTSVALSQNDYARMQQLMEENRPAYVRGPMLYHLNLTKKSALWIKSLLELLRMQGQPIVLLVLLLLVGWIVSRTNLFAFLPLLDGSAITRVIAVFCTTTALSGLYQLLIKQAKTVSNKRKLGLSLPYSTSQIIVSYSITAIIITLFLTLAISLLYTSFSIRLLPLSLAEVIAYLVPCCTQLYETRFQRGATTISNMLLFVGVYWFLMV